MNSRKRRGYAAAAATGASLALVLTACSGGDDNGGSEPSASTDCSAYEQYGDLSGKSISVYTSIVDPESKQQTDSYKPFEECTGAKIKYEGSREFEAQLPVRLEAGNAPDIAYIPQPGFLKRFGRDYPAAAAPPPGAVRKNPPGNNTQPGAA